MTNQIIALGGLGIMLALAGIAHLIETRTSRIMTMDPTTAQALQAVADAMAAESAKVAAFLTPTPAPAA